MPLDEKVGLFDNERESNFESTVAMVEDVLLELGHFINDCRVEHPVARKAWRFRKGSAEVLIRLDDRDDFTHIVLSSTVVTITDAVDATALRPGFGSALRSALPLSVNGMRPTGMKIDGMRCSGSRYPRKARISPPGGGAPRHTRYATSTRR